MSPEQAPQPARTRPLNPAASGGLADPAARRWVILGGLGILSSLLLTVAVALLSSRGVASADVPQAAVEAPARNRVTMVREIGGIPKSPTPGTGLTAAAPAVPGSSTQADTSLNTASAGQGIANTALRQLRRVGRAIVTPDGIRRLALGGAVPFADGNTVTAFLFSDDETEVALGESESDGLFLRMFDGARTEAAVQASPVAATATSTTRSSQPVKSNTTPTTVPATATPVPATSTPSRSVETPAPATSTSVPATATPVAATATPVVVTATTVPPTQTPIIVTATPEPTRRATRTPTPEVEIVVVTATPWTSIIPNITAPGTVPWQAQPTNTALPIPTYAPPPTAAPTNTPIPTATSYTVPDPRSAPVQAQAAPTRRAESAAPTATPAGPAPILAETGTRTPATPAPANTPAPRATPQQAHATPGTNAAAQTDASRDPSVMDKLAARALVAVNAARAQAGALPLARNAALDVASALHAQYDVATGQVEGNFQTRGTPQFVGETPSARAARAASGRSPAIERVAEVMALGETEPERAVQGWLDSVFHRVLILDLATQFAGYGQSTSASATTAVLDLGGRRDVANASGWFPAAGATEVPTRCACDDFAEMSGQPGPFGYPVTLLLGQQRPQGMPTVATLSEANENGPAVAAELVDAYGNPTLLPHAPLKPGTVYVVKMAWTNGPSVSWSFTTGG
jgi:uncharacterized protein YkwD